MTLKAAIALGFMAVAVAWAVWRNPAAYDEEPDETTDRDGPPHDDSTNRGSVGMWSGGPGDGGMGGSG